MPNEYVIQADELLKKFGVTLEVRRVGNGCPRFCKDADDMTEAGKFPRKKHIHGDQHLYILTRPGGVNDRGPFPAKTATFDFWDSYNDANIRQALSDRNFGWWPGLPWYKKTAAMSDSYSAMKIWRERNKDWSSLPSSYDLLACLTKYDPGTFKNFCDEFGYDNDSISALETYRAVQEEFEKVRRFFTSEELEQLQEVS